MNERRRFSPEEKIDWHVPFAIEAVEALRRRILFQQLNLFLSQDKMPLTSPEFAANLEDWFTLAKQGLILTYNKQESDAYNRDVIAATQGVIRTNTIDTFLSGLINGGIEHLGEEVQATLPAVRTFGELSQLGMYRFGNSWKDSLDLGPAEARATSWAELSWHSMWENLNEIHDTTMRSITNTDLVRFDPLLKASHFFSAMSQTKIRSSERTDQ